MIFKNSKTRIDGAGSPGGGAGNFSTSREAEQPDRVVGNVGCAVACRHQQKVKLVSGLVEQDAGKHLMIAAGPETVHRSVKWR